MATLNFAHREITAKIVYFGAPSAGSSTNVRTLYELLNVAEKSPLHHFGPEDEEDDIWFFDYMPSGDPAIRGLNLRLRVYAVPGGLLHADHRSEILRGTDAVVYVADARRSRESRNLDSLLDLENLLQQDDLEMAMMPVVIQVNQTDSEDARPTDQVVFDLNPFGFPVVEAVAKHSKGVIEAHERICELTLERIRNTLSGKHSSITLTALHRGRRVRDEEIIAEHMEAIERARRARADKDAELEAWDDLQAAGEIELPFQPADFQGTRPRRVLAAEIVGERVELDLIMGQDAGGSPRRLRVTLANRPVHTQGATLTGPASTSSVTPVEGPHRTASLFDSLPDAIPFDPMPMRPAPYPVMFYAVNALMLTLGLLMGLLIMVIVSV